LLIGAILLAVRVFGESEKPAACPSLCLGRIKIAVKYAVEFYSKTVYTMGKEP